MWAVLAQSIDGKNFQSAESAMIRQECLGVSVVQIRVFGEGGRALYEDSVTRHPHEYKTWVGAFSDSMSSAS